MQCWMFSFGYHPPLQFSHKTAKPQNLNVQGVIVRRNPIFGPLSFDLSQLLNSHPGPSDIVKNLSIGFCGEVKERL